MTLKNDINHRALEALGIEITSAPGMVVMGMYEGREMFGSVILKREWTRHTGRRGNPTALRRWVNDVAKGRVSVQGVRQEGAEEVDPEDADALLDKLTSLIERAEQVLRSGQGTPTRRRLLARAALRGTIAGAEGAEELTLKAIEAKPSFSLKNPNDQKLASTHALMSGLKDVSRDLLDDYDEQERQRQ
jgi:hypothetical protein